MADDVQPDQGQGSEATTDGSQFDSYLSTVPDAAREAAQAWFKDTSKSLNEKLDEAAEPVYDRLSQYQPEQANELFGWHQQVTGSPEAYQEWLANAAKEAGFTRAEGEALEDAEVQGDLTREEIQKIIDERSQAQLEPVQQQLKQLTEARAVEATESEILKGFSQIEKESGKKFDDEERAMIMDLGINEEREDWLNFGYERWNKMGALAQKAFVDEKASAPGSPMSSGGTEAFKPTADWKEAQQQARERWRQAQS